MLQSIYVILMQYKNSREKKGNRLVGGYFPPPPFLFVWRFPSMHTCIDNIFWVINEALHSPGADPLGWPKTGPGSVWPQRSLFIGTVPIGTICQIVVPIWSLFWNFGALFDISTLKALKLLTLHILSIMFGNQFRFFLFKVLFKI